MRSQPSTTDQQRRARLAVVVALLFSGIFFGPLSWSLYQGGHWFWLTLIGLIWFSLGRFCYRFLLP